MQVCPQTEEWFLVAGSWDTDLNLNEFLLKFQKELDEYGDLRVCSRWQGLNFPNPFNMKKKDDGYFSPCINEAMDVVAELGHALMTEFLSSCPLCHIFLSSMWTGYLALNV